MKVRDSYVIDPIRGKEEIGRRVIPEDKETKH
jgi:hypothetical protein